MVFLSKSEPLGYNKKQTVRFLIFIILDIFLILL